MLLISNFEGFVLNTFSEIKTWWGPAERRTSTPRLAKRGRMNREGPKASPGRTLLARALPARARRRAAKASLARKAGGEKKARKVHTLEIIATLRVFEPVCKRTVIAFSSIVTLIPYLKYWHSVFFCITMLCFTFLKIYVLKTIFFKILYCLILFHIIWYFDCL